MTFQRPAPAAPVTMLDDDAHAVPTPDDADATEDRAVQHLMVSGSIRLSSADETVTVRRAMTAVDSDGCPLGRVAGILVDAAARGIGILLGDYSERPVYRRIDPALVARVDEMIHLRIAQVEFLHLPPHQPIWQVQPPLQPDTERPLP